jgi:MFS transporter, PAT family, beta-lactamase induction signal transducer AmpG
MNKALKYFLLTALYLSQGLPFGFFIQALPVMLRKQGLSLGSIGLTSLLALPWALKFIWAPVVDNFGSRRGWILTLQSLAILLLLALAFINPDTQLTLILIGVALTNLIAATQDIATDGLAVDLLDEEERGVGNAIQVAGYRVGMIIGGGVTLMAFPYIGWFGAFCGMAGVLLFATLPVIFIDQWRRAEKPENSHALLGFFTRKGIWPWLGILCVFKAGDYLAGSVTRPWMVDLGLKIEDIGFYLGIGGFSAGLIGAVVGGLLVGRMGRLRALLIFGALQVLSLGGFTLIAYTSWSGWPLLVVCLFEHLAGGMATVALFTCMMDACRPGCGSTDYTIQASLVVFATGLAGSLGGFLADYVGYARHFELAVVLGVLGLVWTALWSRGRSLEDGRWTLASNANSAVKALEKAP